MAATVPHNPVDDSVFIDEDYLIKGVAGAICSLSPYLDLSYPVRSIFGNTAFSPR